jgi:hypothetical protein
MTRITVRDPFGDRATVGGEPADKNLWKDGRGNPPSNVENQVMRMRACENRNCRERAYESGLPFPSN